MKERRQKTKEVETEGGVGGQEGVGGELPITNYQLPITNPRIQNLWIQNSIATRHFILHPSSFILHPSSFILHPSSFILHPSVSPD